MSYPPPPPPGQGGPPVPGGPVGPGGPYQPNPYGASPYGQPPKKDNTLWWVLGIIGVAVVLTCVCVCGFFGWAANEGAKQIDESASSSMSGGQAADAELVDEGEQATDDGATVRSGWRVTSSDDLSGVLIRNDGSSREVVRAKFYFMEDGDVVGTARCSTDVLDPGETDYSPTCTGPSYMSGGYDEIRFAQGS